VPEEVPEDVPEVTVQKEEGFDSCLEEILVEGLGGLAVVQIRSFNKRKLTKDFSLKSGGVCPWQRAKILCSCYFVLVAV